MIEECREKPKNDSKKEENSEKECASPEEIKDFVDTHIIWSGEYTRYVNVKD